MVAEDDRLAPVGGRKRQGPSKDAKLAGGLGQDDEAELDEALDDGGVMWGEG